MNVSDDVLRSVGKLTLECTELETLIEIGIWCLLDGKHGPLVTTHISFPQKCDMLLSLVDVEFKGDDMHKQFAKELEAARWKARNVQTSDVEIDQVTADVQVAQDRILGLLQKSGIWREPSPGK